MIRIFPVPLLLLTAALTTACGGGRAPKPILSMAVPSAAPVLATAPTLAPAADTVAAASPPTIPADSTCSIADFQQEILVRLNEARAASRMCGTTFFRAVAPLAWNGKLRDAAAGHAQDMATHDYFSHAGQDGRSFSQRIAAAGYAWKAAGENIAAGQDTPAQVMNEWLQDPAYCGNIMNGSYIEVGVVCMKDNAPADREYWVMELGRPK